MSLLLDTHVLLWWLFDDPRLRTQTAQVIDNSGADVVVSSVSGFEIATKKILGKLEAPDDLEAQLDEGGFTVLPLFAATRPGGRRLADASPRSFRPTSHRPSPV